MKAATKLRVLLEVVKAAKEVQEICDREAPFYQDQFTNKAYGKKMNDMASGGHKVFTHYLGQSREKLRAALNKL